MGITYEIHTDQNLLTTTWRGEIDGDRTVKLYGIIYGDPKYKAGMNEFADLSQVRRMNVKSHHMQDVVAKRQRLFPGIQSRLAIYAPQELKFGMARMFSAYSEIDQTEVAEAFRDKQEALEWLQFHD